RGRGFLQENEDAVKLPSHSSKRGVCAWCCITPTVLIQEARLIMPRVAGIYLDACATFRARLSQVFSAAILALTAFEGNCVSHRSFPPFHRVLFPCISPTTRFRITIPSGYLFNVLCNLAALLAMRLQPAA
ncbi:unnamed protein product, partial [Ectocarpus sp. 4 AP-2014]